MTVEKQNAINARQKQRRESGDDRAFVDWVLNGAPEETYPPHVNRQKTLTRVDMPDTEEVDDGYEG